MEAWKRARLVSVGKGEHRFHGKADVLVRLGFVAELEKCLEHLWNENKMFHQALPRF